MGNNPSVRQFKTDMLKLVNEAKQNFHQTLLLQADELIGNMRVAAPVQTGTLRKSIRKKDVSTPDGLNLSVLVIAGGAPTTKRSSAGQVYDYSVATEMGTRKEVAEPFFYNTARFYQQQGFDGMQETLQQTIDANNEARALRSSSFDGTTQSHRGAVNIKGKI